MGANPLDSCETDNQIFIYELGEKRGLNYITKNTNVTENKKLTLTLNRTEDDNYRRWKSFITLNFVNWLMGVIYIYIEGRSEKFKCIKHSIFFCDRLFLKSMKYSCLKEVTSEKPTHLPKRFTLCLILFYLDVSFIYKNCLKSSYICVFILSKQKHNWL